MKKSYFFAYLLIIALIIIGYNASCQTIWAPNPKYIKKAPDTGSQVNNIKGIGKMYRCWGTTKKGLRCKRGAAVNRGFCYQHSAQQ